MAARRDFFAKKFSEYRQNYLPFDYYDFWLTAKENENLRFKNKLRDYLHTPFDWDENLDVYKEADMIDRIERANQATQTSDRPNRHDYLKKIAQNSNSVIVNNNKIKRAGSAKKTVSVGPTKYNDINIVGFRPQQQQHATKSAYVQVNLESTAGKKVNNNKRRTKSANKTNNGRRTSQFIGKNEPAAIDSNEMLKNFKLARSVSNIALQTPFEWNLRDYSSHGRPLSAAKLTQNKTAILPRPHSVASLGQPVRPPFANYGWASKTKDLSIKPTRNVLANKVLARKFHDENALSELKLQKLKKEANQMANEQLAMESKSLDRFRSESRDWSSEYDLKFPDYTKLAEKDDYYLSLNPNKLKKSTFSGVNFEPLRRAPPRSAKGKLYSWEQ